MMASAASGMWRLPPLPAAATLFLHRGRCTVYVYEDDEQCINSVAVTGCGGKHHVSPAALATMGQVVFFFLAIS